MNKMVLYKCWKMYGAEINVIESGQFNPYVNDIPHLKVFMNQPIETVKTSNQYII